MEIAFYTNRAAALHDADWQCAQSWSEAECLPRKGELVKVTVTAGEGEFRDVAAGSLVEREMRVIEVCHTGPYEVKVYLVPTNVRVASL